jgi:hypothetical protein
VQPEIVVRWHRKGFQLLWRLRSRPARRDRAASPSAIAGAHRSTS